MSAQKCQYTQSRIYSQPINGQFERTIIKKQEKCQILHSTDDEVCQTFRHGAGSQHALQHLATATGCSSLSRCRAHRGSGVQQCSQNCRVFETSKCEWTDTVRDCIPSCFIFQIHQSWRASRRAFRSVLPCVTNNQEFEERFIQELCCFHGLQ